MVKGMRCLSKDPGPEDPALVIPGGVLGYWHSTLCGVLEYWSDGVMEKTPFSEFLESQIYGENLKVQISFFQDQHSNTPVLQYSG